MKQTRESKADYDLWHQGRHEDRPLDEMVLYPWHRNGLSLLKDVAQLKNQQVLEVGCGAGDFSIYLAKHGANVTAIDFSEEAIRIAQLKSATQAVQVDFVVKDAQDLSSFPTGTYDVIFSFECLEHLPDPQRMVKECYRVLKTNGKIILTTENYSNAMVLAWVVTWLKKKPFDSGSGVQPIENFFVFWVVKRMFRKAGFKEIKTGGTHHVFLLLPRLDPRTFVKNEFRNGWLRYVFKPFARHMTFYGVK
ncbi:MAG: methyltransferase domain-containing protein [Ferruginibacter sp.]|nr:methyltransferase domain-containing protein [Cytophagales bacterium]